MSTLITQHRVVRNSILALRADFEAHAASSNRPLARYQFNQIIS